MPRSDTIEKIPDTAERRFASRGFHHTSLRALAVAAGANLAAVMVLSTSGCSLHEVRDEYPSGVEFPAAFSQQGEQTPLQDRWWESFGEEGLNRAVESVLRDNPGLRQAWSRMMQAEAVALSSEALRGPEISAEGTASRARTPVAATGGEDREVTRNQFRLALGAGYEVDLWRRLRHLSEGADLSFQASREDVSAAAMSLAAASAETWFASVEQNAQLMLLEEQVRAGETSLALLELRFALGQATALDLYQQRQQLAATKSQIPLAEVQRSFLRHRMAALAGRPPDGADGVEKSEFPPLPPYPDPGIPAFILHNRPDVRAAFLRVKASDHAVASAIAELLPALRLSAGAGFQASDIADTFSTFVYQLAAGVLAPMYDGGRRNAEVRRRKEILEEQLHRYRETVVEALREVEDAMAGERRQEEYLASLREQMQIGRSTLEQARLRYGSGLSDYLPVLTALQALQVLERSYLTSLRTQYSYRIQLYRALGGSWAGEREAPTLQNHADVKGE